MPMTTKRASPWYRVEDDQGCHHGAGQSGPLDRERDPMATPWSEQPDQTPSNQRSEGG